MKSAAQIAELPELVQVPRAGRWQRRHGRTTRPRHRGASAPGVPFPDDGSRLRSPGRPERGCQCDLRFCPRARRSGLSLDGPAQAFPTPRVVSRATRPVTVLPGPSDAWTWILPVVYWRVGPRGQGTVTPIRLRIPSWRVTVLGKLGPPFSLFLRQRAGRRCRRQEQKAPARLRDLLRGFNMEKARECLERGFITQNPLRQKEKDLGGVGRDGCW